VFVNVSHFATANIKPKTAKEYVFAKAENQAERNKADG